MYPNYQTTSLGELNVLSKFVWDSGFKLAKMEAQHIFQRKFWEVDYDDPDGEH